MLPIPDLDFGYSDAENYLRRENKEKLEHVFLRTPSLDGLCEPAISFLVGEKGTGKTAYATFIGNTSYQENIATVKYMRETDYLKFISLREERHLVLSDYASIWKVVLYLLMAQQVLDNEKTNPLFVRFTRLHGLRDAIDEYYAHAFSPEIVNAIQLVQESSLAAELMAKHAKASGAEKNTYTFSETRFQINLLFIQKQFEEALSSLKLRKNYIVFIDGIDVRPDKIPFDHYLDCVKGLANAIWAVNNDFFPSIKDSPGRMRCVLSLRPDIFTSLGLQNQNMKIRDNSVLLDWQTTYPEHRTSPLFEVAGKLLASQQPEKVEPDVAWDHYFPYKAVDTRTGIRSDPPFVTFLRFSYYRPRDIVTMLGILQENFVAHGRLRTDTFREADFDHHDFRRKLAEYLLGEVKDHLSFYYSAEDYTLFRQFFTYLRGASKFTYSEFLTAYEDFETFARNNKVSLPQFFESADTFLQFLYDLNVLSYVEKADNQVFVRWCFRERTLTNITPKVQTNSQYEIHYGLTRALKTGRRLLRRR